MQEFNQENLKNLYIAPVDSSGEENGQITIIGNSNLFHGAAILALKAASRLVDMVFFTSPWEPTREIAAFIKAEVPSFIWVPFEEVKKYIEKSDAVLIGPGFKRYASDPTSPEATLGASLDDDGLKSRNITKDLLEKFPNKNWVIDAGSLQTMEANWIPENAIITPNNKEFELLFSLEPIVENLAKMAIKHKCVIVSKGATSYVANKNEVFEIKGGNAGLTKGGTGDVLAGLATALFAKNDAILAASAASFVQKQAAEDLEEDVGTFFNADDLANQIPYTFNRLTG